MNEKAGEGNISKHVRLEFGDVDGALAAADHVIEGDYWYEGSTHAPLETHCCVAEFDATGCSRCGRAPRSRTTCTATSRRC